MKTSGFRVPRFYRVLAEKEIRFPRTTINRWLSLVYKLTEEDLKVESEVLIRSGRKQDLDFLLGCEDSADPGRHILLQDIKFWDQYGFRCLYTGYLNGDAHPFLLGLRY